MSFGPSDPYTLQMMFDLYTLFESQNSKLLYSVQYHVNFFRKYNLQKNYLIFLL